MQSILITGGNRGLGYELAAEVLENNPQTQLVISARSKEQFEQAKSNLAERLKRQDLNIKFIQLDLLDKSSVEAAVESLKHQNVKLDVLVNNAAVWSNKLYPTVGHDDITVNFVHTRLFTELLLQNGFFNNGFRIINISAIAGNITILKKEEHRKEFRDARLNNINALADKWIDIIDNQKKAHEYIDISKAFALPYAVSKLCLNVYTRYVALDKIITDNNGGIVAVHPGVANTNLVTRDQTDDKTHDPSQPLIKIPENTMFNKIEEGVWGALSCIKMSDQDFKKLNGKFTDRKLNQFDFLDASVDFVAHAF